MPYVAPVSSGQRPERFADCLPHHRQGMMHGHLHRQRAEADTFSTLRCGASHHERIEQRSCWGKDGLS